MVNYQQLSTLHLEKINYFSFTININFRSKINKNV